MSAVFYEEPIPPPLTFWDLLPNMVLIVILFAILSYLLWQYSYTMGYQEGQESMRFDPPV